MSVTDSLTRSYTLDSLQLNAVLAALDERGLRLLTEYGRLADDPPSRDRDFAIACNKDAIRDTERERLAFARQLLAELEQWTEPELREVWGNR